LWGSSPYHDFEDSLNQAVRKLRLALQDSVSTPRLVETIPRRGYRLNVRFENLNPLPRSISKRDVIVSRQRELTELQAVYKEVNNGRSHMVCVAGEPGIGKATLCETLLVDLSAES